MLKAYEIGDEDQQKALLLHHAGAEIFEIFTILPGNDSTDFDSTLVLLDTYFYPKKNEEYEVHKFRKVIQIEEETIDVFHTRIRKLAVNCKFNDLDTEIQHHITNLQK